MVSCGMEKAQTDRGENREIKDLNQHSHRKMDSAKSHVWLEHD
jgi:hypothetical protein